MSWAGWPWERVTLLFIGLAFGMISFQVFLMHLGGAFHKWQMWVPVLYGPVLMLTGLVLTALISDTMATVGISLFAVGILGGLAGTFYHFKAIGQYIMGYRLRNLIAGPPPVLPPIFAALSAFGLLAIVWADHIR